MKKVLIMILFTGIAGFILYQGSRNLDTSLAISDRIVNRLLSWWLNDPLLTSDAYYQWYPTFNYIVRKSAHFLEYALLGGLLAFHFRKRKGWMDAWVYSLLPTLMIALLDEKLQKYVGRSSSVSDVILDGLGAMTGVALVLTGIALVKWIQTKMKFKAIHSTAY